MFNVLQICAVLGMISIPFSICDQGSKWALNVLQDGVSVSSLREVEPGFDLTDEEIEKFKIWRRGIIPYYIDLVSFDKVLRDRIRNFLDITGGLTGLQFLELPSPPVEENTRWVFFVNRRGTLECSTYHSSNFTNVGVQKVVLGYDCVTNTGQLAKLVLVLAGVPAQHTSPDRDEYITVNFDKIIPEKSYLYEKLQDKDWLFHDLEYDFASAGHFHLHENTIDGTATIQPKDVSKVQVGEGEGFSYEDILKIRMMYNYISTQPSHLKGTDCKKLFKPGSKLGKYDPPKKIRAEPRAKPHQYLGVAPSTNDNDVNNIENATDAKDEGNNTHNDDQLNIEQDADKNDEIEQLQTTMNGDPLKVLSDYETDIDGGPVKKGKNKKEDRKKLRN